MWCTLIIIWSLHILLFLTGLKYLISISIKSLGNLHQDLFAAIQFITGWFWTCDVGFLPSLSSSLQWLPFRACLYCNLKHEIFPHGPHYCLPVLHCLHSDAPLIHSLPMDNPHKPKACHSNASLSCPHHSKIIPNLVLLMSILPGYSTRHSTTCNKCVRAVLPSGSWARLSKRALSDSWKARSWFSNGKDCW